jgi:hypothetical protein
MIISGLRRNQIQDFVIDLYEGASSIACKEGVSHCCGVDLLREKAELVFEAPDGYTAHVVATYCPMCKTVRWWDE